MLHKQNTSFSYRKIFLLYHSLKISKRRGPNGLHLLKQLKLTGFESNVRDLQAAYLSKDSKVCIESYKICLEGSMEVHVLFEGFT